MVRKAIAILLSVLMLAPGALAAPAPPKKKPPVTKPDARDQEIDALQKQVDEQNRLLQQMRQELDALKQAQPVAAPSPAAQASPAPEDTVLIDDSVPPSQTGAPTAGATPAPGASPAPGPAATGLPSTAQTLFNPQISVIGLFEGRTSSDKSNRFDNQLSAREVEIALQAPIDPFARYDVFLTIPNGEGLELEEGYATFLELPLDTQAKMGKFKASFGRNNLLHTHAFPQIDRPKVIEAFFGEEGLNGPGLSLATLLPTGWFSEFTGQAITNDNDTLFSGGVSQTPIYVANWRNLFDLREDLTLELGLSGAWGKGNLTDVIDTTVGGAAMTWKYKPLRRLGQFGVTWETEYLTERQRIPFTIEAADPADPPTQVIGYRNASGLYSYVEVHATQNWFGGIRYDHTHKPINPDEVIKGVCGWIGYRFSEFSSLRLQYGNYERTFEGPLRQWFLQWNVVIGPHGAHKY